MPKRSFFTRLIGLQKEEEKEEEKEEIEADREEESTPQSLTSPGEEWLGESREGQLSVDVYQTNDNIVVKSTIAGVKPENIDISINNDMLTIRGKREQEYQIAQKDYFYQECYWGSFSRSIVLPTEVKTDQIEATLKNGILTIVLPKAKRTQTIAVKIKEE